MSSPALERHLPALVLVIVGLAYLGSVTGGFVWDDHGLIETNAQLRRPLALIGSDIAGGDLPEDVPLYRPLVMLSFAAIQWLAPGPLLERLVNLGLYAALLGLVARLARHTGATRTAAWSAALLLGVHPGTVECVAWISGRHELLPAVMTLLAWTLIGERPVLAGLILALTPFAKESWLVVPAATALLFPWFGRAVVVPTGLAAAGVAASIVVRARIGEALHTDIGGADLVAALGGTLRRGVELLVLPHHAGPTPYLGPSVVLGVVVLLVGPALVALSTRVRPLAFLTATGVFLAPAAVASFQFGVVADRYFLLPLTGAFLALTAPLGRLRSPLPALVLALPLAGLTATRAQEWTSDLALFSAAFAREPNDDARFYLGAALQTAHRCPEALPLLEAVRVVDRRSLGRLQACYVEVGRYAEALAMVDELEGSSAAQTTAKAYVLTGDLEQGEAWARKATALRPESVKAWTLLGNILGQRQKFPEAGDAFTTALALDPDHLEARKGLAAVERHLATP